MGLCPFISSIDQSGDSTSLIPVECVQAACQLWDAQEGDCVFNTAKEEITNVFTINKHLHDSHNHFKAHTTVDLSPGNGDALTKSVPYATPLVVEAVSNEDLDANGYVYAKDFYIDPDDSDIPEMVAGVEISDPSIDKITWAEYLDSTSIYSIHVTS